MSKYSSKVITWLQIYSNCIIPNFHYHVKNFTKVRRYKWFWNAGLDHFRIDTGRLKTGLNNSTWCQHTWNSWWCHESKQVEELSTIFSDQIESLTTEVNEIVELLGRLVAAIYHVQHVWKEQKNNNSYCNYSIYFKINKNYANFYNILLYRCFESLNMSQFLSFLATICHYLRTCY